MQFNLHWFRGPMPSFTQVTKREIWQVISADWRACVVAAHLWAMLGLIERVGLASHQPTGTRSVCVGEWGAREDPSGLALEWRAVVWMWNRMRFPLSELRRKTRVRKKEVSTHLCFSADTYTVACLCVCFWHCRSAECREGGICWQCIEQNPMCFKEMIVDLPAVDSVLLTQEKPCAVSTPRPCSQTDCWESSTLWVFHPQNIGYSSRNRPTRAERIYKDLAGILILLLDSS